MPLHVDLSSLFKAVEKMGAVLPMFTLRIQQQEVAEIDIELRKGKEIFLNEINFDNGLASYKGRQVLLYIQDHGWNVLEALGDGSKGNKFHVCDCQTLKKMRRIGRFDRYVVTNDLGGFFLISGKDGHTREIHEGRTALKVCKWCLTALNYQGYRHKSKMSIFNRFNIPEFFSTYSSFFPYMPKNWMADSTQDYTPDWKQISEEYRSKKSYRCEYCCIDLNQYPNLLHVHHVNGIKNDNQVGNLRALCVACHREQPLHDRMFVRHQDMVLINRLRREQQLLTRNNWSQVLKYADPGLQGLIDLCQRHRLPVPEVGYKIVDRSGTLIAEVELAWASMQVAVAIDEQTMFVAKSEGWQVWPMMEAVDNFDRFATTIR
jgi:hypothetical protein